MNEIHPKFYPGAHLPELAEKPAVILAETGEQLTYAELDAYANRVGRLYRSIGLQEAEHVAYYVENRLDCIGLQWGAHYVGLYYTFINTRLKASEVIYILENCEAQVLVVSAATAGEIVDAVSTLANPPKIYCLDEFDGLELFSAACAGQDSSPLKGTTEGNEMLYSSGTTGTPKGVKPYMTQQPLGTTCVQAGLLSNGFGMDSDSIYLSPAPFYHAAPLKWSKGVIALGGTVVLMQKFRALEALQAIETYAITHSQWVPTMFSRMLALSSDERARFDLSSHKLAIHAAAPCPIPIKQAMLEWWGPIVAEYYSCTELIGMTKASPEDWMKKPGTVGRAIFGVIRIIDDTGEECAVGNDGLVYFSDGQKFSYHKDEIKTREAYNEKGWATVGDIGHVDADGFLYLTDRKSNMIISGGVNVYPQEVENLLISHPKIFDAAVIGTPHHDLGEEVRAVIQLKDGVEPNDALKEELINYTRDHLSHIKCPRVIDFSESLPREPNGKMLKRLLKERYH